MTAATETRAPAPFGGRVTQRRVVSSEWIKLWSLRSTVITLAVAVIGMIGIGWLVSYFTNAHWSEMRIGERLAFNPVDRSMAGVFLAELAIGVLGVLVVTGEYATGMIRATFSAVPRRLPVVWAKLAVYAVVSFLLMLVAAFASFFGGQALLASHGTDLSAPGALRAVFGAALYLTVVGALGVGLGFLIRHTAGAIATLFGLLLILPPIMNLLPSSWQDAVSPYLPSNAGQSLFLLGPGTHPLSPWVGFAVFCGYAVAAVAVGAVLLLRRDA